MGCHFLLQGIFPTQGLNPGLLHCRQTLYRLSHQGSPHLSRVCVKKAWSFQCQEILPHQLAVLQPKSVLILSTWRERQGLRPPDCSPSNFRGQGPRTTVPLIYQVSIRGPQDTLLWVNSFAKKAALRTERNIYPCV